MSLSRSKERVTVQNFSSYGRHPWVWNSSQVVQRATVERWLSDWRKRRKTDAYTFIRDNRDAQGFGSVELHYYYMGVPNGRKIEISEYKGDSK